MQLDDILKTLEDQIPLDKPAIGLAFRRRSPRMGSKGPTQWSRRAAAFWYEAETDVFYAAAEDHYNCPLGAMVMGFPLGEDQMGQLMREVGMMCESSYVREEEVPNVPKVDKPSSGIVYGPLSRLPGEPGCRCCCGSIPCRRWWWARAPISSTGRPVLRVSMDDPACAAIPVAIAGGTVSQSFRMRGYAHQLGHIGTSIC